MSRLHFASPEFLYLLILIPGLIALYWYKLRFNTVAMQISSTRSFAGLMPSWKQYLRFALFGIRILAITALIFALARPQTNMNRQDITVEGIDIILATDISSTMLSEDLKPNRLEAAKEVGIEFINSRPDDRIGLVVFSGESFTQCPLTANHATLINQFKNIGFGMIDDGTAIGDGLATAINRLKESTAKSKIIVLLTDGMNNRGSVDPLSAAEIAEIYNIRIYTIGAGTMGFAPAPVNTVFGIQYQQVEVKIDEPLLQKISALTNGKYFRATNKQKLKDIYQEIDRLEKSRIDVTEFSRKKEEFLLFAITALILLAIEFIIRYAILKLRP